MHWNRMILEGNEIIFGVLARGGIMLFVGGNRFLLLPEPDELERFLR